MAVVRDSLVRYLPNNKIVNVANNIIQETYLITIVNNEISKYCSAIIL